MIGMKTNGISTMGHIIEKGHAQETGEALNSNLCVSCWPAPVRECYFSTEDYVAACMRTYTRRMIFDGFIKEKRADASTSARGKRKHA